MWKKDSVTVHYCVCDLCGKETHRNTTWEMANLLTTGWTSIIGKSTTLDFCPDCTNKIEAQITLEKGNQHAH